MGMIKKISVKNSTDGTTTTYDVGQMEPAIAEMFSVITTAGKKLGNVTFGYKKPSETSNVVTPGKINIEGNDDIQLKPGDDLVLTTSHRGWNSTSNSYDATEQEEFKMSVLDASDVPCRLKTQAKEMTWITDYTSTDGSNEIINLNIRARKDTDTTGDKMAYLKIRARAIDLRCEEHGGIALQPFGSDTDGHMNKVKFEHGGGDGFEFFTMNTNITSMFTNQYRFNKDGIVKMSTRESVVSDKWATGKDETMHYKYVKQSDDFYDKINDYDATSNPTGDPSTTWGDIIKTSNALNTAVGFHTKITSSGNLEIAATNIYAWKTATAPTTAVDTAHTLAAGTEPSAAYNTDGGVYMVGTEYFTCVISKASNNINIESDAKVSITAKDQIELNGTIDFGDTFSFGETEVGIQHLEKYTAKKKDKVCDLLQVVALNNSTDAWTWNAPTNNGYTLLETATIPAGSNQVVASVRLIDLIGLMKRVATLEAQVKALTPTT